MCLLTSRASTRCWWRTSDTLKGTEGIPMPPGRTWERRRGVRKVGGRMGLAPLREAEGGERFPHSEGPTHGVGIDGDGEGPSGDWGIREERGQHLPCHLRPGKPPGPESPHLAGQILGLSTPAEASSSCTGPGPNPHSSTKGFSGCIGPRSKPHRPLRPFLAVQVLGLSLTAPRPPPAFFKKILIF